jgi:hypothetical protein
MRIGGHFAAAIRLCVGFAHRPACDRRRELRDIVLVAGIGAKHDAGIDGAEDFMRAIGAAAKDAFCLNIAVVLTGIEFRNLAGIRMTSPAFSSRFFASCIGYLLGCNARTPNEPRELAAWRGSVMCGKVRRLTLGAIRVCQFVK